MNEENYFYFEMKNGIEKRIVEREIPFNTSIMTMFKELTNEQKSFYISNPAANMFEVKNCKLNRPTDTLEAHKSNKINEIEMYDISDNVNGFYLNNNLVWLDKATRVGLVNTLNSAELVGRTEINIWFSGVYVTLPITQARQLLARLELYATDCYNTTEQHKVNVNNLETIEAVDAYDHTANYPGRLVFNL